MKYVVQFDNGYNPPFWLADWKGDPGRTVVAKNARRFENYEEAEKAMKKAVRENPFRFLKGFIQEIK